MTRSSLKYLVAYVILAIAIIFFLFPIFWMFLMSIKKRVDMFSIPPVWIFAPTIRHYKTVLTNEMYIRFFMNSIGISICSMGISVFLGSLGGYSLARFKIPGGKDIAFWILTTRMAPPAAVVLPIYLIMSRFHLLDTRIALIMVYTAINLSFVVWLMRGFFLEIPEELEEAALIDGSSRVGAFFRIILPLSTPGLVASAIFCIVLSWNEFLFALTLTGTQARTLPVTIAGLRTPAETEWGQISAMATFILLPILIFAWSAQRYLVRGLTFGAVRE